jgi:hypothetical protein
MLTNFISIITFDPANLSTLMNIEMLQYTVTAVPSNGYAITDLNSLLIAIIHDSGQLCIAQVTDGGQINGVIAGRAHINGVIVNNILHTVEPQITQQFCSMILNHYLH